MRSILKTKNAAMEMSMGTIVTIVLLVSVMILGLFFVRRVMCSGIVLIDDIDQSVKNELKDLFGIDSYGVKCMGEGNQDIRIGGGGKRKIFCIINTRETTEYDLSIKKIESLSGTDKRLVEDWVLDEGWEGPVLGEEEAVVMYLNIPSEVSATSLKIEIEEINKRTGITKLHKSYIDVVHISGFTAAVC